jgi:nitroimidazol reductase NimA-like FMN-containing flavoprotein (pyridoxamine 5'-phosphate oxidase superfamily)
MLIHELTVGQCREVLGRISLGRLACARDDQPYIVPIFFSLDLDGNCLYSFSTLGQKIEWMRGNPKVCVEVEEITDRFHWTTVLVTGRYSEISDAKGDSAAFERVRELFQQRPEWWLPATAKLATGEEHVRPVFYRIRIDQLSGRRAARQA